ncbi:MAG: hypothetical protein HOV81_08425 [Kofleriaceae bacterium]|nr:hypothetical protein [Kofleriaceae bacterium]
MSKGTVHDLGYKRYVGSRRAPSTRWRVIMRNQIAMGWKTWWRYKLAVGAAVVATFVSGGLMYFANNEILRSVGNTAGGSAMALKIGDAVLPLSIEWFLRVAFVLSLTLGATIVATDTHSGAFTFYFVRSVRARDYVIGKLAGYGVLVGSVIMIPLLVLSGLRLGLSTSSDELLAHLSVLPKALGVGALATLVYTAMPLAVSSIINNRRYALALWAAYYIVAGNIISVIGITTKSDIGVLHLPTAINSITYDLFDVTLFRGFGADVHTNTAIIGLLVQSGIAIAILAFQVSRDHKTGVGGAS